MFGRNSRYKGTDEIDDCITWNYKANDSGRNSPLLGLGWEEWGEQRNHPGNQCDEENKMLEIFWKTQWIGTKSYIPCPNMAKHIAAKLAALRQLGRKQIGFGFESAATNAGATCDQFSGICLLSFDL